MRRLAVVIRNQRGFLLPLVLVVLAVIVGLATTMMNTGVLSERVAGNYSDRDRAFYAADATMTLVEGWIKNGLPPFEPFQVQVFSRDGMSSPYKGFYDRATSIDSAIAKNAVGRVDSRLQPAGVPSPLFAPTFIPFVAQQPVYIVELLNVPCTVVGSNRITLRVTTRGWGQKPTTAVTLQALFSFDYLCSAVSGIGSDLSPAI